MAGMVTLWGALPPASRKLDFGGQAAQGQDYQDRDSNSLISSSVFLNVSNKFWFRD